MAGDIGEHLPIRPGQVGPNQPGGGTKGPVRQGESFKDVFARNLEKVDQLQKEADAAFQRLATGRTQNVTEVLNAVQKADLAFKTLMQIRNKLVNAYDEIRQMRI